MNSEYIRRLVQIIISNAFFDAPGLLQLRMALLRLFFPIGKNTIFSRSVMCIRPHNLQGGYLNIGNNVKINHHAEIDYSGGIVIEDDVWISQYAIIETHKHVVASRELKEKQPLELNSLVIMKDAWIGAFAVILPGVARIGEGAVVGAGSIVTRDVGDWEIVGGAPARVIGRREP